MALIDDADRHEIYLAKLTTHLLNTRVYPSLDAAYRAARSILLDTESIDSIKTLKRLQAEIGKKVSDVYGEGWGEATEDLKAMAVYEAGYSAQLTGQYVGATLSVPAKARIEAYVTNSILTLTSGSRVNSGTWAQYVSSAVDSTVAQFNGIVAQGYQQGQTVGQMTKAIRESSNGILKQQAEAVARTGQSHFATQAREAMALANSDVIKYRIFSATFDNRTTLQCRGNNGKSYAITDQEYPRIPLHFNCRSAYVFVADLEDAKTGTQSAVGGKPAEINKNRKLRYRGKKDKDIFRPMQIDAGITQDQWLRQQPEWFQDSSLGKTRAKLFRDGGLSIDKFTDMTGKPINLDELRQLDKQAFERAGL